MYTCHTYICEIGQPTSRYTHPDEHVIRTYARSCHHHRGVYIKVNTQFCSLLFVRIRFTLPRGCRLRLHVEECAEGTYHGLALRRRDRLRPEGHGLCSSPYLVHLLTLDTPYTTLHYTILHLMLHYTTLHYTLFEYIHVYIIHLILHYTKSYRISFTLHYTAHHHFAFSKLK